MKRGLGTLRRGWQYRPDGGRRPTVDASALTFNHRLARAVVLAAFLLASSGPWADALIALPVPFASVLFAAGVAAPVACLATIFVPSSWLALFVYRVFGGSAAVLASLALVCVRPAPSGLSFHLAALALGTAVELVPRAPARRRDCADVFR